MIVIRVLSLLLMLQTALLYAHPVSGKYSNGLVLAYDEQHQRLTGYYESYTGWDESLKAPRFSCIFYIEATSDLSPPNKIRTWYPGDEDEGPVIEGELIWSDKPTAFSIKLFSEHGGCWNVQPFARENVSFELNEPTDWLSLEIIAVEKAYFHRRPSEKSKTKAYVIARDVIRVIERRPNWVYAEYWHSKTEKTTRGWIKKDRLLKTR